MLLGTFCTGLLFGNGGGLGISDKGLEIFLDLLALGPSFDLDRLRFTTENK